MGLIKPENLFSKILETFPAPALEDLQTIQEHGGMLPVERCRSVVKDLGISVENLMQRLLPLAKLYTSSEISGFQVGAVAKARMSNDENDVALFLGANIEFPTQSLAQTIHAEQSAVINAWLAEAHQIDCIAVTDAPCGYCRQFLYELKGGENIEIILYKQDDGQTTRYRLADFLPQAFGPQDLGIEAGLMGLPRQAPDLDLILSSKDPVVQEALAAATMSHAPYSKNYAACIIVTEDGKRFSGRYAENAAFNPSLSPLHTAIIKMAMARPGGPKNIRRVVMVEKPTAITQRTICELLLQSVAPDITMEYFEVKY